MGGKWGEQAIRGRGTCECVVFIIDAFMVISNLRPP